MRSWTAYIEYPKVDEVRDLNAGELQSFLEERYDLTGHPKAGTLFSLAWDEGHSSGTHNVVSYYVDMAELLDPTTKHEESFLDQALNEGDGIYRP